ncbi:hypothetical protein ACS0TY_003224 [Phlomoides rotata]
MQLWFQCYMPPLRFSLRSLRRPSPPSCLYAIWTAPSHRDTAQSREFASVTIVQSTQVPSSIPLFFCFLENLNHKNIVKYLGSLKTKTHLHIILEYVENGSLANIIKPKVIWAFSRVIGGCLYSSGIVYLHEQGVIHRDIKGANILTTKEIEWLSYST